jgi:hypothetical protein
MVSIFSPEDGDSTVEDGDSIAPKRRYLFASPHGVTTQNANIDIILRFLAAVGIEPRTF